MVSQYKNVHLQRLKSDLRGSAHHALALNKLVKKVTTPYFVVLDADATFLHWHWDEILINKLSSKVPVYGTQAPPTKPQDFPLMFAMLFRTKEFNNLNIDFSPKVIAQKQDTGWMLREKYLSNGYKGGLIDFKNTRSFKKGPFKNLITAEYYLKGYPDIFASHFGRGSTGGVAKYHGGKGVNWFLRLPLISHPLRVLRGKKEKKEWLAVSKSVVVNQARKNLSQRYEHLKICPYCSSSKLSFVLASDDFLAGTNGLFMLSRCDKCSLVFQNPRIKEKFIGEYYTQELGYYHPPQTKKKRHLNVFPRLVFSGALGYKKLSSLGNIISPLLVPFRRFLRIALIPGYKKEGRVLDVGCAHGGKLRLLSDIGWEHRFGIELDKKAAVHAKKDGVDVFVGPIGQAKFKPKMFDAVTMSMVLEHLHNPFDDLKRITGWIKPGGEFLFSIPYFDTVSYKRFGPYAYGLHLPHHLTFFNKKVLRKTLIELGYKNIRFYFQFGPRDVAASARRKYAFEGGAINKVLSASFMRPVISACVFLASLVRVTSRVSVYAKKK